MLRSCNEILASVVLGIGLLASSGANATIYTVGNLTTDDTSQITHDTVTGRDYTRLNAFDFTYAQTVAAVGAGGAWAGWSMMTATVADDFIAALLAPGVSACTGQVLGGTVCGTVASWVDGKLGSAYDGSVDYIAYLNSFGGEGLIAIESTGQVRDYEGWNVLGGADGNNLLNNLPINYVLFRDNNISDVPEPATVALLGLGLAGLGFVRRPKLKVAA